MASSPPRLRWRGLRPGFLRGAGTLVLLLWTGGGGCLFVAHSGHHCDDHAQNQQDCDSHSHLVVVIAEEGTLPDLRLRRYSQAWYVKEPALLVHRFFDVRGVPAASGLPAEEAPSPEVALAAGLLRANPDLLQLLRDGQRWQLEAASSRTGAVQVVAEPVRGPESPESRGTVTFAFDARGRLQEILRLLPLAR